MLKKIFSGFFLSVLSIALIFSLFVSIIFNVVLFAALGLQGKNTTPNTAEKHFSVKEIEGNNKENKILIVPISGVIADDGPDHYVVTPEYIDKVFSQAQEDKNIKGIILKIKSPGGTITATDKMYNTIMMFKEKTKIPVVAYFDEVAASGGYYIAMAADKITSHPTTITGSIGVIMSFYEVKELLENKLGVKSVVIKSGSFKDIASSSRTMTDDERKILEDILMEMYGTFLEKVRSGREALKDISDEELMQIADGRIYTGKQALTHNLVDSLGYFDVAQDTICKLTSLKKEDVGFIQYHKTESVLEQLLKSTGEVEKNIHMTIQNNFTAKFYYMWKP